MKSVLIVISADTLSASLGKRSSWSRYYKNKQKDTVEWFASYDRLKPHLTPIITNLPRDLVLDVGCGTSRLGPQMAADHENLQVHCLDFSLDALRAAADDVAECTRVSCDVTERLPYEEGSAGLVVDKGTMDAVARVGKEKEMAGEVVRVLAEGGKLVQVTTDAPDVRLDVFRGFGVEVSYEEVEEGSSGMPVYLYVVTKKK